MIHNNSVIKDDKAGQCFRLALLSNVSLLNFLRYVRWLTFIEVIDSL
jgi:hypothetical protein